MASKTGWTFRFGRDLRGRVTATGPIADAVVLEFHARCVTLGWRVSPITSTIPAAPRRKRS